MSLLKKRASAPQARRAPPQPGAGAGGGEAELEASELEFMDLRDWVSPRAEEFAEEPALVVRSAEVNRPEDVGPLLELLYKGELLLLDFAPLANDTQGFKTTLNDLQLAVHDLDGDLVGLGRDYLIAAPKGTRVARRKLRLVGPEGKAGTPVAPEPSG